MTTPARQPSLLRLLRPGKPLLGSVVKARDAKSQQLDSRGHHRLVIINGARREPQLLAIDMIMIIKYRHQLVAQVAMGAERSRPDIKAAEVATRIT